MKVKPLHDRVLIKRFETKEQKKGGIIIPDTAKEKPQEAEIVAVGPGKVEDGNRVELRHIFARRGAVSIHQLECLMVGFYDLGLNVTDHIQLYCRRTCADSHSRLGGGKIIAE